MRARTPSVGPIAVLVLAVIALLSAPAHPKASLDIRRDLDEYMQRISARGFSGAVLVAKDGKVILSRGYGTLGPRAGVTSETVFDVVTRQFAAAILKPELQGNTLDRISKYLSGVPKDKDQITNPSPAHSYGRSAR